MAQPQELRGDFAEHLAEDLEFTKRIEAAWKEIEAGKGVRISVDEFLKEIRSFKKKRL